MTPNMKGELVGESEERKQRPRTNDKDIWSLYRHNNAFS